MQRIAHLPRAGTPPGLWHLIAVALALVFIYARTAAYIAGQWWTNENYSHGLVVPLLIAYIVWAQRGEMRRTPAKRAPLAGGALTALALALAWAGMAAPAFLLQWVSLLLLLAGVVTFYGGVRFLKFAAVPLLLLALSIPLPTALFNSITAPLQLFASRFAVWAMRLLQIPVVGDGNIVELLPYGSVRPHKLEVVEACSGIRSLMTLLTMALLYAFITRPKGQGAPAGVSGRLLTYRVWRPVLVVAAAVPLAILTNSIRVGGTGVLAYHYGTKVADGFFHT
ncbi:MAG TPA: exosortase, partial [Pyrinomonadaceae bacterium]|nr:exosortase [Pyrinomonadaceae bacterium]